MDSHTYKDLIDELFAIRLVLTVLLLAFAYIAVILTAMFLYARKRTQGLLLNEEAKAFQAEASGLLSKAEYQKLKDIASSREQANPGDSLATYYLGMAHFRCEEYIPAKRCFESLLRLDAGWKKVATAHLEEISTALKKLKPKLVDE